MPNKAETEQIQWILRSELRAYAKAYRTVQFALYVLPAFLLLALALYLFLWWLGRPLQEFHNLASAGSYLLAGFLGYAWWAFNETLRRAEAVSAAKVLAELHGLKVLHWPGGKGINADTVELVGADSQEGVPVNWSRDWRRWDCLANLI